MTDHRGCPVRVVFIGALLLGGGLLTPSTGDAQQPAPGFAAPDTATASATGSIAPPAATPLPQTSLKVSPSSLPFQVIPSRDVSTELVRLLDRGGIPTSIEQLRQLERQQRQIVTSAASSTVSVQIGPAQGCGVIITESGYVLTAAHVAMRPGKQAKLSLSDGRTVTATTLGMNRGVDAGLMKINAGQNGNRPWPHARLGSSRDLIPGMWCIATGHPGGYDRQRGQVARIGRILDVSPDKIVTDCALIGGDSGGPLFDISGKLIAVHSRIGNDVAENLHVPIDHYDLAWDGMQKGRAWGFLPGFKPVLGVSGVSESTQALVGEVRENSPAEEAGIEPNDIIEQFGDVVITSFDSLKAAVADTMPGERLSLWINRDGRRLRLDVEIGRSD